MYLEDYDWPLGALLTGGVDLWLNTPKRPYEASGTSGMKAALNGVPSFSVLDGWWVEGWNEGVTGWAIGDHDDEMDEANELYERLEQGFYRSSMGSRMPGCDHAVDDCHGRTVFQYRAHG